MAAAAVEVAAVAVGTRTVTPTVAEAAGVAVEALVALVPPPLPTVAPPLHCTYTAAL